ncbi:MAG: YegP family protein [Firmicutes bacterium]|nr:YegP family protein [Bacillota bacterium]
MGKFVIKETKTGYHFNLVAGNGQVIGSSQTYASLESCKNGIESVKNNCVGAVEDQTVENVVEVKHPKFEVYTDKAGEFRFRLKARNGENILASEGYTAKASCMNGIESVKKNAPEAETQMVE